MSITLRIEGLEEAARELEGVQERMEDMRPVLRVVAQDLKTEVDDAFDESRSPDGKRWKPLAEATVKRRRQGSRTPLVDTGTLRNSIAAQAERERLRLGTNVPYAASHQFGREHIPARPFLPITPEGAIMTTGPAGELWEDAAEMIRRYILTGRIE